MARTIPVVPAVGYTLLVEWVLESNPSPEQEPSLLEA